MFLKGFEDCIPLLHEGAANACKTGHFEKLKAKHGKKAGRNRWSRDGFVSCLGSMIYSLTNGHSELTTFRQHVPIGSKSSTISSITE
jgi:hypothetical protein